jgi:hypothetical protein
MITASLGVKHKMVSACLSLMALAVNDGGSNG